MMNFTEFLSDYYVRNLGFPIFSIVMTTGVKIASRKDHSLKVTKNDFAIGVNLIVAGIMIMLNYAFQLSNNAKNLMNQSLMVDAANKLANMLILVLMYSLAAFIISVLIRLYGWKKDNETELNTFMGVIVPLIVGSFLLVVAVNFSNQ